MNPNDVPGIVLGALLGAFFTFLFENAPAWVKSITQAKKPRNLSKDN